MEIKNVLTKEEKIKYLAQMDRERKFLQIRSSLQKLNARFLCEWRKIPFIILETCEGFRKNHSYVPPTPSKELKILIPPSFSNMFVVLDWQVDYLPIEAKTFIYRGKTERYKNFNTPIYEEKK